MFGVDADAIVGAEHGELFAEIEQRTEFADRFVALEKIGGIGGGAEPVGEPGFAASGAGCGEQFKETAASEDIEIERVGMVRIEETLPGLAAAVPAMRDAGESTVVEGHGAAGQVHVAFYARLSPDEGYEDGERYGDQPGW